MATEPDLQKSLDAIQADLPALPLARKPITVLVINESTVFQDAALAPIVAALKTQVNEDFCPFWNIAPVVLGLWPKGTPPPATAWQMVLLDNSDQADALGYHDLTAAGLPIGKVFVKSDLQAGAKVSVTVSHELLEMLADPFLCYTVQDPSDESGQTFLALEVCDAPEADNFGYDINGVTVSDFVFPSWFDGIGEGPFDFRSHLSEAGQIAPGGYIGVWTPGSGWQQKIAETSKAAMKSRANIGSRRERRRTPRNQWVRSTTPLR
jgi:hypothetical protein